MEITIHSNVTGLLGSTTITVDADHTVGSLIREFCSERGICCRSELVLSNGQQEVLAKNRTLASYDIRGGEELYLSVEESDEWPCGCNQWFLLSFVTFFIGAVGITAVAVITSFNYSPTYTYGVGVDAGSSHSTLYVYQWPIKKRNGTGVVDEITNCHNNCQNKSMRSLSSFVDNPSLAGDELRCCLDEAKKKIPHQQHGGSPVFLGATAGMRLLKLSNSSVATEIMSSIQKTMSSYPFMYKDPTRQVRILEGSEEGTFSWISTNYLLGNFGFQPMARVRSSAPPPTIGALDLGGASTQITFVPEKVGDLEPDYSETVSLYGSTFKMYTHSYLCYGLNEAYRRYRALLVKMSNYSLSVFDPCSQLGLNETKKYEDIFQVPCTLSNSSQADPRFENVNFTFVGSNDTAACRSVTKSLFDFAAPCPFSRCSFGGVYQPPVHGNFLGFSGFYYTFNDMGLPVPGNFSLDDFISSMNNYCSRTVRKSSVCFSAHYINVLLVDAYGFNETNWHRLTFAKTLYGAELGWILGMMINTTTIVPEPMNSELISLPIVIILFVLFALFIVVSIGFLRYAVLKRRRGYQRIMLAPMTTSYGAI